MRDKESVTQFFILYGYEKAPDAYSTGGFLFFPRQHLCCLVGVR